MKTLEQSNNKNNIIIKFGKNLAEAFAVASANFTIDHPFILFNFEKNDKIEKEFFNRFRLPQYISYIKDKYDPKNPDLNLHKILSYIWEKDCYYNERGNLSCQYSPANLLYKPHKGGIFCNILLIGESRAGKSSFINRMFKKYITNETGKFESTTREITYYEFEDPENNEKSENNSVPYNEYGHIRIIDTPGLIKTDNLDSSKKILEEMKNNFDNIHLIFFFMKGQSNIEEGIEILKYIKKMNLEREKNNNFKIPIIFIKNGEDLKKEGSGDILFDELKKLSKKYDLIDLYDSFGEKSNKLALSQIDFLSFENKNNNLNDYKNYIDGNIIQIHLPTGKNINQLFSISKEYILKNNSTILEGELDNEYNIMMKNASLLVNLYIKEKLEKKSLTKKDKDLYTKLYKECNEFAIKLQKSGSILYNLNILNIKKDPIIYLIVGIISGILTCFFIFPIIIYGFCLYKISYNIISNIAAGFGFDEQDIYQYGLDKYVYSEDFIKDLEKDREKSMEKIREFFRNIIYYTGPIQFAIKTRKAIIQIKDMFVKLSNIKDEEWNSFNVEKI